MSSTVIHTHWDRVREPNLKNDVPGPLNRLYSSRNVNKDSTTVNTGWLNKDRTRNSILESHCRVSLQL